MGPRRSSRHKEQVEQNIGVKQSLMKIKEEIIEKQLEAKLVQNRRKVDGKSARKHKTKEETPRQHKVDAKLIKGENSLLISVKKTSWFQRKSEIHDTNPRKSRLVNWWFHPIIHFIATVPTRNLVSFSKIYLFSVFSNKFTGIRVIKNPDQKNQSELAAKTRDRGQF